MQLDHIFPGSVIGVCTLRGKFLGRAVRSFIDAMSDQLRGYHAELWEWVRSDGNKPAPGPDRGLTPVVSSDS